MPGGMMKSNGNLVELIEKVKPEIRTLIEKCNTVSNKVMVAGGGCRDDLNSRRFVLVFFFHALFFPPAGQNVGTAAHPQDRGWQQLWGVHPGRNGS